MDCAIDPLLGNGGCTFHGGDQLDLFRLFWFRQFWFWLFWLEIRSKDNRQCRAIANAARQFGQEDDITALTLAFETVATPA